MIKDEDSEMSFSDPREAMITTNGVESLLITAFGLLSFQ